MSRGEVKEAGIGYRAKGFFFEIEVFEIKRIGHTGAQISPANSSLSSKHIGTRVVNSFA